MTASTLHRSALSRRPCRGIEVVTCLPILILVQILLRHPPATSKEPVGHNMFVVPEGDFRDFMVMLRVIFQ